MDLTTTTAPKSDQLNADDLMAGPVTVTITNVRENMDERGEKRDEHQPVNIDLAEYPGRAYRPNLTMRRVLVAAWDRETANYVGRRMTLYRDPDVRFGRDTVGGIKISALSHIPKPLKLALTETRGKRKPHVVDVLPNVAPSTLTRMPEETTDRIEALMAQLGLEEATEKHVTSWATGGRTDDWTALTAEESARLIGALEKKAAEQ